MREIKIRIPDIKSFLKNIYYYITDNISNSFHKLILTIEKYKIKIHRKTKDTILRKLTDDTQIRFAISSQLKFRLLYTDFYSLNTKKRIFRYYHLTGKVKLYRNEYAKSILMEKNIIVNDITGLMTVRKDNGTIETGILHSYSYGNKKLHIHYSSYQYEVILNISNESLRILMLYLDKAISNRYLF